MDCKSLLRIFVLPLLFISLLLASCKFSKSSEKNNETSIEDNHTHENKKVKDSNQNDINDTYKKGVPKQAYEVANYVYEHGKEPDGYVGGRKFENRENLLPIYSAAQKKIFYKEYDIFPKVKNKNRGPHRIVLGSNNSRYYTSNHYKSFIEF